MKKRIRIRDFESYFPQSVLSDGWELSEYVEKWDISEEKGSINATYTDHGLPQIHARINKTPLLILNFQCDCLSFNEQKGCKHITGILYYLRNKSVRLTPVGSRRRVGVDELLSVLQKQEMESFIRFYASNNPSFSKIFKQFFSYKFNSYGKGFNDYITEISHSYINVAGKLDSKGVRALYQIYEMHILRTDTMLAAKDWTGAVEVIEPILLQYFKVDFEHSVRSATQLLSKAFQNLSIIINQPIAPGLKRQIQKLMLTLLEKEHYNYFLSPNAIDIGLSDENQDIQGFRTTIINRIKKKNGEFDGNWLWQLFQIDIRTDSFNLIPFYAEYLDEPSGLESFLKILTEKDYTSPLIDRIIEIVIKKGNLLFGRNSNLLAGYLIRNKKIDLYRLFFERIIFLGIDIEKITGYVELNFAIQQVDFAQALSESNSFRQIKASHPDLYMEIIFKGKNYNEALDLLSNGVPVAEMVPYVGVLTCHDPERMSLLLKDKLKHFLDSHLGIASKGLVEEILSELEQFKQYNVADEIREFVRKNYPERKTLIKTL